MTTETRRVEDGGWSRCCGATRELTIQVYGAPLYGNFILVMKSPFYDY